jgi:hypothetical protein
MKYQAERCLLWYSVMLFAVFFIFSPCSAQSQTTSSITGIVLDVNGKVILNSLGQSIAVGVYPYNDETNRLQAVRANAATGVYTLTGLPLGKYKVKYFTTGVNYISTWYKDSLSFSGATVIDLTSATPVSLGEIKLATGAKITGNVLTALSGGSGIANVFVQAYSNGVWARTSDAATDAAAGGYTISGLAPGSYTVRFWAYQTANPVYATEWYSETDTNHTVPDTNNATAVSVATGEVKAIQNAVLSTGGSISGTVLKAGTPVVGGMVAVYDSVSPHAFRGFTTTGTGGGYAVEGLPSTGSYVIQFYEKFINNIGSGLTEWYDGQSGASSIGGAVAVDVPSASPINATLDQGPISGKVTYITGSPVVGASVKIYATGTEQPAWPSAVATTDDKGSYISAYLPAGNYRVQFFEKSPENGWTQWYQGKDSFTQAADVLAGSIGVNAVLKPSPLAPLLNMYNVLLLKKRCVDENGNSVHCNCMTAGMTPAYCK